MTAITRTFSAPTDTHWERSGSLPAFTKLAFYDELLKISAAESAGKRRRKQLGRWLKGTAAVAAGTGVGTGVGMLLQEGARRVAPKTWAKLSPRAQLAVIGPASAAATLGAAALAHHLMKEKRKYEQ